MGPDNAAERISLERRMSHLEGTVKAHGDVTAVAMERLEEKIEELDHKLDRVVEKLERPKNWGAIATLIAASIPVIGFLGWLLYAGYIKPLEDRLLAVETKHKLEAKTDDD